MCVRFFRCDYFTRHTTTITPCGNKNSVWTKELTGNSPELFFRILTVHMILGIKSKCSTQPDYQHDSYCPYIGPTMQAFTLNLFASPYRRLLRKLLAVARSRRESTGLLTMWIDILVTASPISIRQVVWSCLNAKQEMRMLQSMIQSLLEPSTKKEAITF